MRNKLNRWAKWFLSLFSKSVRNDLKWDDINQDLNNALRAKRIEQIHLTSKIVKDIHKKHPTGISRFIKRKRMSNAEIISYIQAKYGSDMSEMNLKITNDLSIVPCV